jgi:hypothetical protein
MAITQCQLALPLSRLMAVAAFSLFLPFPKRTGPNVLENDFLPAKPNLKTRERLEPTRAQAGHGSKNNLARSIWRSTVLLSPPRPIYIEP